MYLPLLFGIQFALTLGLALLLACGHVHFRDVGNLVNVLLLFGFYATPVFYPLELVRNTGLPAWLHGIMMNPMAGLLTAYRQALFEQRFPEWALVAWPLCCAVAVLLLGASVFRRYAATMADYL